MADVRYAGPVIERTAGENLAVRTVAYANNSGLAVASNGTQTTRLRGLMVAAVLNGETAKLQVWGPFTYASWSWTPGADLYVAADGTLTETVGADLFARAETATRIWIVAGIRGADGSDGDDALAPNPTDAEWTFGLAVNHQAVRANSPTGTTQAIDWRSGCMQRLDLSGAMGGVTVTFTAPAGPAHLTLIVVQGSTARDVTWPGTVKWDGEVGEPTWSGDASKTRIVVLVWDGTNYYAAATPTYS